MPKLTTSYTTFILALADIDQFNTESEMSELYRNYRKSPLMLSKWLRNKFPKAY